MVLDAMATAWKEAWYLPLRSLTLAAITLFSTMQWAHGERKNCEAIEGPSREREKTERKKRERGEREGYGSRMMGCAKWMPGYRD